MPALDDLAELRTFALVVEAGSLAAAARLMQVSGNAVSRRIMRLERNLGVKVLRRSTRAVSVTAEGRALYARARRALDELDAAAEEATSASAKLQGSLRVAVPGAVCTPGVLAAFADLLAANPAMRLEIVVANFAADPISGGFDVALRVGQPKDSRLIARRLFALSWCLAAAPRYLAARPAPRTPADLSAHACLRFLANPPQDEWRLIDGKGEVHVAKVGGNFEADDSRVLGEAVYAGLGIGLRPVKEVEAGERAGKLVRVLPGYLFEPAELFALTPKGAAGLRRVSKFLDLLTVALRGEL
jgi:DNA-binding transcriptional LysR family regulator